MNRSAAASTALSARCCIVGGGPAGMMLGLLLARAGVDTVVLEKHGDFLRDFRGDTIHPSTLELMYELGLLDDFLKRPHNELQQIEGQIGTERVVIGDFSHLPTRCKFIALMPQWEFLDFLAERARRYPSFRLEMDCEADDLIIADGRVAGVVATSPHGILEFRADLVIGADGRHSTVRQTAGLESTDLGAPIDVLWMRVPKDDGDAPQTLGRVDTGRILVMLDRCDYWQCAFVIRKGGYDEVRQRGLPALRDEIARLAGLDRERLETMRDWSDIKLLTVAVDRLRRWHRPGLLCIGDAAHAMSPIGGVGINLAIQDAVAAANILVPPLRRGGEIDSAVLDQVQRRRELPTRIIQRMQLLIQDRVISRVLGSTGPLKLPLALRLLRRWPVLRRLPARLVGLGFRPEHVETPELVAAPARPR
ncbi:MAG TPA: FAD-dependent oxidoreductase [Stellaceae bacterium]|nr:FAD-dependent oxidoreductase [Stellaceae bacterium]